MIRFVPLGNGWTLWSTAWLRSAGFPSELVLPLASERAVAAVRGWTEADKRADEQLTELLERIRQWTSDDWPIADRRHSNRKLKRRCAPTRFPERLRPSIDRLISALEEGERARSNADEVLRQEEQRVYEVLRELSRESMIAEAMAWQNRRFYQTLSDARDGPIRAKTREKLRRVALYVQRYATKNDTIGFFGPGAWADAADATEGLTVETGHPLIARRTTYLESWGIHLLADALSREPELRPHLRPRMMPTVRLEGSTLYAGEDSRTLPEDVAALLRKIDGERSAQQLSAGNDDTLELLEELAESNVIRYELEVPSWSPTPEVLLRGQLERLPKGVASGPLRRLAQLEEARDAVHEARGASKLAAAAASLEARFEEITGGSSTQKPGETYGARTLYYQDCTRNARATLGRDVIRAFSPALRLLLASARWCTHQMRRRTEVILEECHGGRQMEVRPLVDAVTDRFADGTLVESIARDMRGKWKEVLRGEHLHRSAEIEGRVLEAFNAPAPGWAYARVHSPDLIIGIRSGRPFFVLGEVHAAGNTLLTKVALSHHPEPSVLFDASRAHVPPQIALIEPKHLAQRAGNVQGRPFDFQLEAGVSRSDCPPDQIVRIADLYVSPELRIRSRVDEDVDLHVMSLLGQFLSRLSIDVCRSMVPEEAHTPRITFDDVVVARAAWRLSETDLAPIIGSGGAVRLRAVGELLDRLSLPRFVFARFGGETKPLYVDFHSPVLIEVFIRHCKRSTDVELTEMLPAHDELWLTDADGKRYTSELRFVTVDPNEWQEDV